MRKAEFNALDRMAAVVHLGERQLRKIALDGGDGIGNGLILGELQLIVNLLNHLVFQRRRIVRRISIAFLKRAVLVLQPHAIGD